MMHVTKNIRIYAIGTGWNKCNSSLSKRRIEDVPAELLHVFLETIVRMWRWSDVPVMHYRCSSGNNLTYYEDHRLNVVSLRIQASVVQISQRTSGENRTHCKFD